MIKLTGEKLRQYDLNRTVELIPKHGHEVEQVMFFKNSPEPLVVAHAEQDGKIIAPVPNILLKNFGVLTVECHTVDDSGQRFSDKAKFYVSKRAMPDGYVYEETPVLTLGSSGSGGGGVSSWNDLTDKPFYKEQVLCEIFNGDIAMDAMEVADMWRCIGHANITPMDSEPNELIITVNGNTITLPRNEYGYGSFNLDGTSVTVRVGANNANIEFNCVRSESFTISCKIEANFSSVKPIDTELLPKGHQFGCEIGEVLSECELWGMDADEDGVNDGFMLEEEMKLTVGKTYTVNYNGTEYSCVAQDISETTGGIPSIGLGNMEPMGLTGNGEPFAIMYCPEVLAMQGMDWVYGTVMVFDEAETVTLSIKGEVVTPIGSEYLPAETVRRMVVNFTTEDGKNVYADKDFYEIKDAYLGGYDIVGVFDRAVSDDKNTGFETRRLPLTGYAVSTNIDGVSVEAFTFSCFIGETSATLHGYTILVAGDEIFFTETYLNDHSV